MIGVSGVDSETFVVLLVAVQSSSVNHSPHCYLCVKFLPEDFVLYTTHCLIVKPCSCLAFDNGLFEAILMFKKSLMSWKVL